MTVMTVIPLDTRNIGIHTYTALGEKSYLRYTVVGAREASFPRDMLRYDVAETDGDFRPASDNSRWVEIDIRGLRCTPARWSSFGWSVKPEVREYRTSRAKSTAQEARP